jgi:Cu-processing system permease protein
MFKIIKYVIVDILRNKIILFYTLFLLVISLSVFNLEDTSSKGLLSLLNIILFIVPLINIIFSTIYIYNSSEFIELLVSQPLHRRKIWSGLYAGLGISLSLAFFIGVALPVLIYEPSSTGISLIIMGVLLSLIFVGIAMLSGVMTRDKAKGIGIAVLLWLYFSLIFDGLVLFILFQFTDYPMDQVMIGLSFFNPIDMARIQILLEMDVSALMGYTGAVFKEFYGTTLGITVVTAILLLWVVCPFWISLRRFAYKDL